jgi:hypothetical protein
MDGEIILKMVFKKGQTAWNKGKKCKNISKSLTGRRLTDKHKENIGKSSKGRKSWIKGLTHKKKTKDKISNTLKEKYKSGEIKSWNKNISMKKLYPKSGFQQNNKFGYIGVDKSFERIINESKKLKRKGYRVIPIGKVIPDIIAIKNNKVYAIEVEFGRPNYSKYDKNNYKKYFDEIKWIIKRKRI